MVNYLKWQQISHQEKLPFQNPSTTILLTRIYPNYKKKEGRPFLKFYNTLPHNLGGGGNLYP